MLKILLSLKLAIVASVLFLTPPAVQKAEAGINLPSHCKLPHIKVHYGVALKKSKAQSRARRKWQTRARQVHGWKYRLWSKAYKRNSSECHKSGSWWKCAAGAYACKK